MNPRLGWTMGWILLFLFTGACSILDPDGGDIRVKNNTDRSIAFFAWDLETSHLLDLAIDPITVEEDEILLPGTSKILAPTEVNGEYRTGRSLRLFVYEVSEGYGTYLGMLTFTGKELRESDFRISVESS
jgi:hypothetical protein